jgi:hypothetical protein
VIETMRRDAEMRAIEIGRLTASIALLNGELAPPDEFAALAPGSYKPRPRVSPLSNGNGSGDDQTMELATVRDGSWDSGS